MKGRVGEWCWEVGSGWDVGLGMFMLGGCMGRKVSDQDGCWVEEEEEGGGEEVVAVACRGGGWFELVVGWFVGNLWEDVWKCCLFFIFFLVHRYYSLLVINTTMNA